MPLISVIIPVYNLEDYVAKCVESCIGQTFRDIEIICVNDGSKDKSLDILRQFGSSDSRVKVIDTPNQGVVRARETGLDNASGQYISFVDGDDHLPPDALEKLYAKAIETGADIVNSTVVYVGFSEPRVLSRGDQLQNRDEFIRSSFRNQDFYLLSRLFKREIFERRPFTCPPDITHNEDVIIILSLAFPANTIASIPAEGYYYLFRQSSVSGSFSDKQYTHVLKARKLVLDIFRKEGMFEKYRSELLFFLMIALFNIMRYGNAGILSPEDLKFLSLKNLLYGDVRHILKKHLPKTDYRMMYAACTSPRLFKRVFSALRKK